jgi:hypothetical protein
VEKLGVRYAEMLVDWLNAHMDDADAQEVAHLVSWYNVDRLEEDFPHLPHDVSEDELLRRVPRRLRHGLHGIRVDMHIHPSWDEGQKLHRNPIPDVAWTRSTLAWPPMSGGSKLTTLKLSSGRYILGIKSKRDTWDGLGYVLSLLELGELWRIRQCKCNAPNCSKWFAAGDHSQQSCSRQCRQKKYAQSEKGKRSNVIRQGRYQRKIYRSR